METTRRRRWWWRGAVLIGLVAMLSLAAGGPGNGGDRVLPKTGAVEPDARSRPHRLGVYVGSLLVLASITGIAFMLRTPADDPQGRRPAEGASGVKPLS